jgi:hypothetical protein
MVGSRRRWRLVQTTGSLKISVLCRGTVAVRNERRFCGPSAYRHWVRCQRTVLSPIQGVLDAYGHVSIRHPANPNRYLIPQAMSPANVTAGDVMEFDLDSNSVDQRGRSYFSNASSTAKSTRLGRT